MEIRNSLKVVTLLFALALFSCDGGGEKPEEIIAEEEHTSPSFEESKFNAQNVFNTLPERQMVMDLIAEHKLEYNPDLLNDPNSVGKYSVEFSKGINLGIYGADLCVSSSFDQTQESMVFLKCVNVLAQSLGVNSAFDQRMFERIDANNNNKDSVLEIVTDAFRKVDEILKYNNRPATSAIILAGCWIEGLYISANMAETVQQEKIIKSILAQKESLKNLIVMMESVKLEEGAKYILEGLKKLHESFIAADSATKLDKAVIADITKQVSELRSKVVSVSIQ